MWGKVVVGVILVTALAAFVGNRPERRPGNLTPIQLISALGAWALVFANVSALAIAIHSGSLILLGSVVATVAIALTSFFREDGIRIPGHATPEPVKRF